MSRETVQMESRTLPGRQWMYMATGVFFGGVFFYLAARNANLSEALALIYTIDAFWIMPFTVIWLFNVLLRSFRWQYMFPDESRPSFRHALDGFVLSKVGNIFLPGRLGEVLRAGVIGRFYPRVGLSGSLATVVVEKILDSFAILAMLGVALFFAPLPDWITQAGTWLIVGFSFLLLVLWGISRTGSGATLESILPNANGLVLRIKTFLLGLIVKFSSGLHTLRAAHHFTFSVFLTVIIWAGESAMLFALIKAFSISAPFTAAVVGMVFLCIGGMLPTAPGFVGTYQLFIVAALQIFGVPETDAFALSLFMNLYVIFLVATTGALVFMAAGGMINVRQLVLDSVKKA
ncbi:MAG: flippase-like domain-containing protein [Halioglobus sp.]|nr:flippase-like domain-containing protein [Halioglobus sp.]